VAVMALDLTCFAGLPRWSRCGRSVPRGARGLLACAVLSIGCRVPREVHEPREYPKVELHAHSLELRVVDAREGGSDPSQELSLPASFEARARERLATRLSGTGPDIDVSVGVAAADEIPIVDARGEMTRVLVRLSIEIRPRDGVVLRRAETQSSSDIPRDEATPEEVAFVLDATAIDAFDRYFSGAGVFEAINRELDAYAQR
jgi:hypothetical protein